MIKNKLFVILINLNLIISYLNMDCTKEKKEYEFGLDMAELEKRTSKEYINTKKYLKPDAPEYLALADGDKEAIKHLVKSGVYIEKVNFRIDNRDNIPFKAFLEEQIKKGNKQAELTKILFDAQKGIHSLDRLSNKIHLAKGIQEYPGKGVYPEDLSKEEFHKILIQMIKDNKIEEVKTILNQRSMVVRDGSILKGIDYVEFFKEEFGKAADELEEAAKLSTNKDFNEYLVLQAKALRTADPMLDAEADKKWADLQDTPLEYTITRENYEDELTGTAIENEELNKLMKEKGINPVPKDFLGARVGIVNKKGTEAILGIKKYLPTLAQNMPYNTEYEQNIKSDKESKQTMVDVDLIMTAGDVGAYRAGITLAENLPNDDKLSLTIGGGRRNVFHRQIRFVSDQEKLQKLLDEILDKEQHKYYDNEADHWFTIGHENTHSLGPKKANDKLGKYSHIIEENKADMGGLAFVDLLTQLGFYSEDQRVKIIVTAVADTFLKTKPTLSQAHRVRTVMQNYYLFKRGAYVMKDGTIHVNIDKVVPAAKEMLAEIVRVQIDDDLAKGEKYVMDNFVWTDEMELIGQKIQKVSKELNGRIETELADKLLAE